MRVKRGIVRHRRHKKIRTLAKGYAGRAGQTFVKAKEAVIKAGQHSYMDRKKKKRTFRSLWIIRMNAAAREQGMTYGSLIHAMKEKKIGLDRKTMSELAIREPKAFEALIKQVAGR